MFKKKETNEQKAERLAKAAEEAKLLDGLVED
jgi:hypothetical protein